jgi:hypothetical protein
MPEEDRNTLARNLSNHFKVGVQAALSMSGNVNTRIINWLMSGAIRGNITPTQPDATNEPLAFLWTYQPGLTTANTPDITNGIDTFTFEFGDNIQDYEAEYAFVENLTITGSPNEPVTYESDWIAHQVSETTLTPALSAVSTQRFPSNLVKFYVDADYASIGGTQVTDTLIEWSWSIETMFTPRYSAGGNFYFEGVNEDKKVVELELTLKRGDQSEAFTPRYSAGGNFYFEGVNEDKKAVELELTLKRGDQSEALKDIWDAQGVTYLRIQLNGATEIDSGQTNPPYVNLDGAFIITEWPETDDADGAQTVSITLESTYDSVGAKQHEVAVLTDLAAYPS